MKHWKLLLSITLLASCGQMGLQQKMTPTTGHSGQHETVSSDVRKATQAQLSELHALELIAFNELENWSSASDSRLVALRQLREELSQSIDKTQEQLLREALDPARADSERLARIEALQSTLPELYQLEGTWRYTLRKQHQRNVLLAQQLKNAQAHFTESVLLNAVSVLQKELAKRYTDESESMTLPPEWKKMARQELVRLARVESFERVSKSIEHLAHEIRFKRDRMKASSSSPSHSWR